MTTPTHTPVKNALTGASMLLPVEDAALYEQHVAASNQHWQPETHHEKLLAQSLADLEWRMQKIPTLIEATLALARLTHAADFADKHPMLLEAHIHQTCARDLKNFNLQESRLHRQREKDMAELRQIQNERRRQRDADLDAAAKMHIRFEEEQDPFDPAEFGFEFSIDEIEERVGLFEAQRIGCEYPKQFAKYIHAKLLHDERLGLLSPDEEEEAA